MNKERRTEIKNVVLKELSLLGNVQLPIPIKRLVKMHKNCRLITYSRQMRIQQISYQQQLQYAGSPDAHTDYYADKNCYIIYYNDLDTKILNSNRYRWRMIALTILQERNSYTK